MKHFISHQGWNIENSFHLDISFISQELSDDLMGVELRIGFSHALSFILANIYYFNIMENDSSFLYISWSSYGKVSRLLLKSGKWKNDIYDR